MNNNSTDTDVRIAPDEYAEGVRALRSVALAVFMYRRTGRGPIEAAGYDFEEFLDLIDGQVQTVMSCITPRPVR